MRTLGRLEDMAGIDVPVVLAIGFFDGVHRGHQEVVREAVRRAAEHAAQSWILTFNPHPLKVINPERAPSLLTSTPHKLRLLKPHGIDGAVLVEFTAEFRNISAEAFIDRLCRAAPTLRHIVVGSNWAFGRERSGTADTLSRLAERHHITTSTVDAVMWNGEPISSTRIRRAVARGDLAAAEAMLDRPYSIRGDVVHGRGVGAELGFPTANVDPHNEVHPPPGIYAAVAVVDDRRHPAAVYIGQRPTFGAETSEWVVETYLMDADLELYGQELEIFFIAKIRDDRKFSSKEELSAQIARDVEKVRKTLAGRQTGVA